MLTQQYSEQQRRAVNLVWTAAADYRFEPRFLALRTDGAPDFYMNCVIGYVHKWFGDDMPARLFASWAGDVRQAMFDDLAWLALENAAYERELPQRPALVKVQAQGRLFMDGAVELQVRPEGIADGPLQLVGVERAGAGEGAGELLLPRVQRRRTLAEHALPAGGLERIDQLVLVHPLLP